MTLGEAARADKGNGIRHEAWPAEVYVRHTAAGWMWRTRIQPSWTPLPTTALAGDGLLALRYLIAQGWSVAQ